MVASRIEGIALRGIVGCVPEGREGLEDLARRFGDEAAHRIAAATGIESRRIVAPGQCTSDLAEAAARRLLDGLDWTPDSVDLLVVVTQTHDHLLPGTASVLHRRLGLRKGAAVIDVTHGCSGFVYGLWVAAGLLRTVGGRALLLVGDTTSRLVDPDDRAVAPLFGDGAGATALEVDGGAPAMSFDLGSDGAGAPYLSVEGGAMRRPDLPARLFMDGTQVFAFTLREVPASIGTALEGAGWSIDDIDHLVLHQANAQMIRHLGRKLGVATERTVVALQDLGNTSSASIPLALTAALGPSLTDGARRLLLSGFGVGWSWGSVALIMGPLALCETVVLPGNKCPADSAVPATSAS
ncbi:ketoacyl-ACP synthase III [Azospirillum picis]|uniref:3-oxoacyl-[acyl-carrier-protein] synthase-3 n=1 Tax=Azospirillum picis TaxID=488438 RepID=A0ABU0MGU1_9PROT|nr:ketoacyl-ACP synthase III [Azospirillum picis]MBP2299088.1 3-oxoacyl-[acyl-carrier-protein] synthase-3 [Azospirillum picis]MDQ0532670.1 3-oxoacyl-[acyl-carrier-protein] synthase-3 [Azospirillum picis]